jgi:uncharacterized protein YlzI (FlbEa/FlbD family)
MSKGSGLQRSVKRMKDKGYRVAKTEKWNPFAHVRQDLYNFADIVCIRKDKVGVLAINSCGAGTIAHHIEKFKKNPDLKVWLAAGNRLIIHGWWKKAVKRKKKKKRGKSQKRWVLRLVFAKLKKNKLVFQENR